MEDEKNLLISIKLDENKIAAKLKDINKNIEALESENKNLQKSIDAVGDKFGIFGKKIQENNATIKTLQEQSKSLQSQLSNVESSTDKTASSMSKLNTTLGNTSKDIKQNTSDYKDLSSSIRDTNTNTIDFAENNKRLEATINSNKSALEKLNTSAQNLRTTTKELDDIVVALSSKPITLDTTNAINSTIALKENLLEVADGVEEMSSASLDGLLSGVQKLQNALPVCNQAVEILNTSFKNLGYDSQVNLSGISTAITSIAGVVEGIASENYAQAIVAAIPLIGQGIDLITKKIKELRDGAYEFKGIWGTMDFETTRRAITGVEDQINKGLNPKSSEWYKALTEVFNKDIPDFLDEVVQFVAVVWQRIFNNFRIGINRVNDKIKDLLGVDILDAVDDALIKISSAVSSFFGTIRGWFNDIIDHVANGIDRVIGAIGTKAQKARAEQRRAARQAKEEEERDYENNLVARAAKARKADRERRKENREAWEEELKDYEDNLAGAWAKEREQRRQAESERQQAEINRKQAAGAAIQEIERLEREADLRREERLTRIEELNREMQTATCEERKRLEGEILTLQLENAKERADLEQQKLDTYLETLKKVVVVYDEASGKTIEKLVDVEATSEQAEIINQLKINLEKYNREVENLDAAEQQHNATIKAEIDLYKAEQSLAQKKRDYDSAEIDRKQQIIELQNQDKDTTEEVLAIKRQSLEEKIALIEQEIALEQQRIDTITGNTDAEVEALHRLQMSLKETQNELTNLNSGIKTSESDVSGFGSAFDKLTGDIGTASGALSMLGITGVGALKKVSMGLKAIGKLFTTWPLVAIAAIITVIATVVKGVSNAFKENEELTKRLHDAFAAFEPILDLVKESFELLAEIITFVVEGFATLVRTINGSQEAWEAEQKAIKETQQALEDLEEAKRKYSYNEAERAQEITELNQTVKDKELKTIDERIAAQNSINEKRRESLVEAKRIADEELRIAEAQIKQLEDKANGTHRVFFGLIERHNELTEEEKQNYDELIAKVDEYRLAAIKANYAVVNSYAESKDAVLSILSELTTEQIKEKIRQLEASKVSVDEEIAQIERLEQAVMRRGELEEAVLYLRQKGVALTKEEAENWEKIYSKLIDIKPVSFIDHQVVDDQLATLREALARSEARDKKTTTPTKSSGKSDAEKEAEAFAKYWNDAFDAAEKGLNGFHKELLQAQRDFRELGMTKLQIFDLNMEDTMKELDARKDEIQAKLHELQNTTTQTPEQEEQKQQSIAYYTEMYNSMEELRTAIQQKAAVERAKIEVEMQKEAQEKIVKGYEDANEQIERQYRERELAQRQKNGGSAELSPIQEASLELEKAKEELQLLQDTLGQLDPASEEYQEFADKVVEANLQIMDSTNTLNDAISQTVQSYTNAFSSMASSMNSYYAAEKKSVQNSKKTQGEKEALIKRIEEKERATTLAQIAFSTASSIAQVVADAAKAGWPAMIPILIGGIATVIAAIASAKSAMSGYAEGGIIPGTSYSGDKVQARVNSGEMVLTTEQQKQLFDIANGRGSAGMNYELMVSAFSQAVSDMPAPVLDYQEFITFVSSVNQSNNLVKLR